MEIGELYDFMKEQFVDLKGEVGKKLDDLNNCLKEQQRGIDSVKTQTIENTTRLEIVDCRVKESCGKVNELEKNIVSINNRVDTLEKMDGRDYKEKRDKVKWNVDVRNSIVVGIIITIVSYLLSNL